MTTVKLGRYGRILTGREFGGDVMSRLAPQLKPPVALDFAGVATLGSSFGDEVVPKIAALQNNEIEVRNVAAVVWECLSEIARENGIALRRN